VRHELREGAQVTRFSHILGSLRAPRRRRDERGAVIVEFALVVPLLLLLVFGILEFGYMMNRATLTSNASRDGAREASLGGTYASISSAVRNELGASGINLACQSAVPGIKIDCKKTDGTACNATSTTYDTLAESGTTAIVTVTYDYTWITPLVSTMFGSSDRFIQTTQMRVE
jgi:Flp pilus assembly protein TadG